MTGADAEWVPNGEEPEPPYEPPPVDDEIAPEQYDDGDILEGLDKIPTRDQIIAGIEEFREPFAQTRRREIAAESWPDWASEIWSGHWQLPSPDDVDPDTGKVTDGVRWSDNAGCPVHMQATSQQERHIAETAISDANTLVDSIVQRYEELLDDANYENSLYTARKLKIAKQMLAAFSLNDDPDKGDSGIDFGTTFSDINELFETDWTGDEASRKGEEYFGSTVIKDAANELWIMTDAALGKAVDDIRAQITLYGSLGQTIIDTYEEMAKKTHLSMNIGVLQGLADTISTVGLWAGKVVPGVANATGWVSSMVTKAGDLVITISWDGVANSNDIEEWTSDFLDAADTVEEEIKGTREDLSDLGVYSSRAASLQFIPGEGYQDD